MKRPNKWIIYGSVLVIIMAAVITLSFPIPTSHSQDGDEESCDLLVEAALQQVGSTCSEMGRNEACYGHFPITTELREDASGQFDEDGDLIDLLELQTLQTESADPETGDWGVALMTVQADLPEDSDESMTFVLFGDTEIQDVGSEDAENELPPMQSITLSNGEHEQCSEAPDGLLVRSPDGQRARISVNGVELTFSSVGFLHAQPDGDLRLMVLEGEVVAESQGGRVTVGANEQTTVPLDGLAADGVPMVPTIIEAESEPLQRILQIIVDMLREHGIGVFVEITPDNDGEDNGSIPPTATPDSNLPPDGEFEINVEAGICDGEIEAGQVVRFSRGVGRWETEAEANAELGGATAIIILDGVQLPIADYDGLTIHTGGGDEPGYGNRAFAYWIATPGEHTISGEWSIFGGNDLSECTFTVG